MSAKVTRFLFIAVHLLSEWCCGVAGSQKIAQLPFKSSITKEKIEINLNIIGYETGYVGNVQKMRKKNGRNDENGRQY